MRRVAWSDGSASSDARAFLQTRVELYTRVLLWFFGVFALLGLAKIFFVRFEELGLPGVERGRAVRSEILIVALLAVLLVARWLLRQPHGARAVATIEAAGTLLGCLAMTQLMWMLPDRAPLLGVAFPITLVLVLRAAIVPSSPVLTFLVGALVTLAMTLSVALRTVASPDLFERLSWLFALFWGGAFTVATAIVSKVIYGLRERVRAAMRLGNYTLAEKLGEGGMGEVYLAHHAFLKRPTAIKLLPPERAGERTILRFEREVRELSRLCHPNTVAIYDFGRTPEGIFYYAMEYLEGLNLEELVEMAGPQPPGRVIHVLAQVAHALSEAHGQGLIHRDVKPANVVLSQRGGVSDMAKVVDFGLVKDIRNPAAEVSSATLITGTPLFMAPESIIDPERVDGRTDLYALGAVGYFFLTGEYVFDGRSLVEVCSHHLHTPPEPPSRRRDDVPADLERVILRCLAKNPADRYCDAKALRSALLACASAQDWDESSAEEWWSAHRAEVADHRARERTRSDSPTEIAVGLVRRVSEGARA